jgi:hypothetical protein
MIRNVLIVLLMAVVSVQACSEDGDVYPSEVEFAGAIGWLTYAQDQILNGPKEGKTYETCLRSFGSELNRVQRSKYSSKKQYKEAILKLEAFERTLKD